MVKRFEELNNDLALLAQEKPRAGESVVAGDEPEVPQYWFVELWHEKREFFKEFVGEVFLVGLFLLSFEIFHRALGFTSLEPDQIELLNKTHFYLHYGSLVILSFGFIITVLKSIFRGKTPR